MTATLPVTEIAAPRSPLDGSPYQGYAYAYPHKSAYRPLRPSIPVSEAWSDEPKGSVFLYAHLPFCEMRCGFCNLFTTAQPAEAMVEDYLLALARHMRSVRNAFGPVRVTRMAFGGGTPTFLMPSQLERVFDLTQETFEFDPAGVPSSVETSPATATPDRLSVLQRRGVRRISIGVQSFFESESRAAGRPQRSSEVRAALDRIREADFPGLNIDLMYGLPDQTPETFESSIREALQWSPEELYLYPLYVRPLTGLERRGAHAWDQDRLECYRAGRDLLLSEGFRQLSMRHFRRPSESEGEDDGDYCCQSDGMIGVGCGARSYTRSLHYSTDYAVGRAGVRRILDDYLCRTSGDFALIDYGFVLNEEEERRRWILKSLLRSEGLDIRQYLARFGTGFSPELAELEPLVEEGLAVRDEAVLRLSAAGMERSDAIGPWLYSRRVRALSESFALC